ncbi:MAG: WecB/TagA/CpsF family glycosyltransferase [Ignavibacteriales bacterium]|nr:MAG: WecB/TagA/CpsF family glycosyltransferase [Ignavibacteriales bacterium]
MFGVTFSNLDYNSIVRLTEDSISNDEKISIGYVNPHTVRYASKNNILKENINSFTYNHIDGKGMEIACRIFFPHDDFKRLNWTDEAKKYLKQSEESEWKIFFLGSDEQTITTAIKKIKSDFPELKIAGHLNGFEDINDSTVKKINESTANILWVGLGSLRQEKWIVDNINSLNCNVIQSVGDLFGSLAGKRFRGPVLFQKLGLEWMFRLIQHPIKYFDRYAIGVPVFFFMILKQILSRNDKSISND